MPHITCSTPDTVSFDSMISLYTPDETMASHRVGFTHLDFEKGILHSVHTPFANDPQTTVETWLIPRGGLQTWKYRVARWRANYHAGAHGYHPDHHEAPEVAHVEAMMEAAREDAQPVEAETETSDSAAAEPPAQG